MIQVLISGSQGRMGKELLANINDASDLTLAGEIDSKINSKQKKQFRSIGEVSSVNADVLVDFSHAAAFDEVLAWTVKKRLPFVSGTTGLSNEQRENIQEAGQSIPILWAANMCVGVAFFKIIMTAFKPLSNFDFQLEESHHVHKKDRPSGTAIVLQESIERVLKKKLPEVKVSREGEIIGIHKLTAKSKDEQISIEHKALNRSVFASGALRAARWVVGQDPGVYQIEDVLGLSQWNQ